jgi:hypothetical protein
VEFGNWVVRGCSMKMFAEVTCRLGLEEIAIIGRPTRLAQVRPALCEGGYQSLDIGHVGAKQPKKHAGVDRTH